MLPNQIEEWVEVRRPVIVAAFLSLILIGLGLIWWKVAGGKRGGGDKIEIIASNSANLAVGQLVVDVGGAVNRPGVYKLNNGVRVGEALEAAGGLAADADMNYVDMYLNRADKVRDGMKIIIPFKSQVTNPNVQSNPNTQITKSKININTAGQNELESLPGVGPVTAGKIIGGRPYGVVEELLERKIVGQKVFDQIKGLVSTW